MCAPIMGINCSGPKTSLVPMRPLTVEMLSQTVFIVWSFHLGKICLAVKLPAPHTFSQMKQVFRHEHGAPRIETLLHFELNQNLCAAHILSSSNVE